MNTLRQTFISTLLLLAVQSIQSSHATQLESTAHISTENNAAMSDSIIEDWQPVIDAIVWHESKGDVNARNGRYLGPMQIAPILVKECNNILRSQGSSVRYTLEDRRSLEKSREMFLIIMKRYNPANSFELACRLWQSGLVKTYSRANLRFIEEMREIMRWQAKEKQKN